MIAARWSALIGALLVTSSLQSKDLPPTAKPLWTIKSDDCAALHLHQEPWLTCGFQDYTINADQSRILTVSKQGKVQIWDGDGKQIALIEWRDGLMKAGGYPNAWVKIIGDTGVAIVNQSEMIVFDMANGAVRLKHPFDARRVSELRTNGQGRLFARVDDMEWQLSYREVSLADGSLGPKLPTLPEDMQFAAEGDRYPNGAMNEPPSKNLQECWYRDGSLCVEWKIGSRAIRMVDTNTSKARTIKTRAKRTPQTFIRVVKAGPEIVMSMCNKEGPGYQELSNCELLNLSNDTIFHAIKVGHVIPFGAVDENGQPEVRMLTSNASGGGYRAIRVGLDGKERLIGENFAGSLALRDGGMIIGSRDNLETSRIVGPDGATLSIIPVSPYSFGYNSASVPTNNLLSTQNKKWLVTVDVPPPASEVEYYNEIYASGLTMFQIAP
jgi:hypothetical protein